jgi:2-oxoglutarate ferredoxin oxidoreductase subunit delta
VFYSFKLRDFVTSWPKKGGGTDMPEVEFNENFCKGCGLCVAFCPKKILKLDTTRVNIRGYYPAIVNNLVECIGCAACAKICPDSVITVRK